jgi:serine/threonine protein kinase
MEAKLSDFGLAIVGTSHKVSQPYGGTRPYMPPEVFDGIVSPKADVYGLGMTLYELATGLPPYSNKKKQDLKDYIQYIEEQNVAMHKMLDPKARWPKGRESPSFGLSLLQVAKESTTKDHTQRPDITYVLSRLKLLVDKVTAS